MEKKNPHSTFHIPHSKRGFTLIEAVVASSVFVFVVSSIVGVYLSTLQLDNKTRSERTLQQNVRFIMEYLAKSVRNGSVDYASYPGGDASLVSDQLWFSNISNEREYIYLSGTNLVLEKTSGVVTQTTNLNSSNVQVANLKFFVTPAKDPLTSAKTYNQQPNVVVVLELTTSYGSRENETSRINLQTTLSSREYPSREP
ncbi:MAG: hypothetical protein HY395_01625 [Candidatus Doudnabacteria bacterium]|nr:hypothetical protein [Candidatus Doudnabacteria bacterium]